MNQKNLGALVLTLGLLVLPFAVPSLLPPAWNSAMRSGPWLGFAVGFPFLLLVALGLLATRLNQKKIFFLGMLIATIYWNVRQGPYRGPRFTQAEIWALVISAGMLFAIREGRWWSTRTLLKISATVVPLAILGWAAKHVPTVWGMNLVFPTNKIVPDGALVVAAVIAGCALLSRDRSLRTFEAMVVLSFIPLFGALRRDALAPVASTTDLAVAFTAQALLLNYALSRMVWQKVYVDELTRIPNRRAFDERLEELTGNYAIVMVDVDHFKSFNDRFGHAEGDDVLRFVAQHLARETSGKAFRYGGEEFAIVFEKSSAGEVEVSANSIRRELAEKHFHIRARKDPARKKIKEPVRVTISLGIADSADQSVATDVVRFADGALYRAKAAGRNCVVLARSEPQAKKRPS